MIIILISSICLQLFAAVYALTLIRLTRKAGSWLCISIAIILMTIRRGIALYQVINGETFLELDWIEESIALLTSILLAVGIVWIAPIFKSIKETNQSLKASNRALRALSACNQTIIHATDEKELMNEICRVIVEMAGYQMAWVAIAVDDQKKTVLPEAEYGVSDGYLEKITITWDESATGKGPTGTAIRTGEISIAHEIEKNANFLPWKKEAQGHGFRSSIALPLKFDHSPNGALNIYSTETAAFDEKEVGLLSELASDLAFSINVIRLKKEKIEGENRLFESQRRLEDIIGRSPVGVIEWDEALRIISWNPAAERIFGFSMEEAIGKNVSFILEENNSSFINDVLMKVLSKENGAFGTTENRTKDGKVLICTWHNIPLYDVDEKLICVASLIEDNTEMIKAERARETQLKRLNALRRIDVSILGSLDLQITLNIILDECVEQLKADAACVYLYDPIKNNLEFKSGTGFKTSAWQEGTILAGEELAGQVIFNRKILRIDDLREIHLSSTRLSKMRDENFVSYCGVPLIAKGNVNGVIEIFNRSLLIERNGWEEYLQTLAGQTAIAIENIRQFETMQQLNMNLANAYDKTLEGFSKTLELRDEETEGHTLRVTNLAVSLAKKCGIDKNELINIYRGALLHDIGKIGVPDSILRKPGPLTEDEWIIMKKHPETAYKLLSSIQFLRPALNIPYLHHEKWDGSGYPLGLKGEQIPIEARIFAVVDVWDALCSDRPYRKAWDRSKVKNYIVEQSGKHFDPKIVNCFLDLIDEPQPE